MEISQSIHRLIDTSIYRVSCCRQYITTKNTEMRDSDELKVLPYTATSLSVIGRFIFMFLLYKNKSTNSLSLLFCFLSIISSAMWIYYSINVNDTPMITRSCTEMTLLTLSAIYIVRNKILNYYRTTMPTIACNQINPVKPS